MTDVVMSSGVSSETGQMTGVTLSSAASVGAKTDVAISLKSSLESSKEAGMRVVNESSNFTSEATGLTWVNKSSGASSVTAGTKAVADSSGASSEVTTETTAAATEAEAVAATTADITSFFSTSVAATSACWEALGPPFTGIGVLLPTDFFGLLVLALGLLAVVLELALTSLEGVALLSLGLLVLTSAALLEVVGFLEADSAFAVEADLGVSGLVVLAGAGRVSGEDVGFLVAGVDGCLLASKENRIYNFKLGITI